MRSLGAMLGAIRANDFPRQVNESGQAGGYHPSLGTDPDDERLTGIYGSDGRYRSARDIRGMRTVPASTAVASCLVRHSARVEVTMVCKPSASPCSQECSQGTGRQRTQMHRRCRCEQRAGRPACDRPPTCKRQVSGSNPLTGSHAIPGRQHHLRERNTLHAITGPVQ
jgi:hypothetical protein